MPASELVRLIHWAVYVGSFVSIALLFTRYVRVGAAYLATVFASQTFLGGCVLTMIENHYRAIEGKELLRVGMLAEKITDSTVLQTMLSLTMFVFCILIVLLSKPNQNP